MTDSMDDLPISTRPFSDRPEVPGRAVTGDIMESSAISHVDREAMFALFSRYFEASRCVFERDLDEKDWVILLRSREDGSIRGFSTLLKIDVETTGKPCTVLFSGDTVVDRSCWNTLELPRLWGKHVFEVAEKLAPRPVYWFLISSGFRTYRYLPVYFLDFFPAPGREAPAEMGRLLDQIASARFGEQYDPATRIVRLSGATPLRDGISEAGARGAWDEYVQFFLNANPGHAVGDELACLVLVAKENLTRAGRRMLAIQ